jgi:hypothetical protein
LDFGWEAIIPLLVTPAEAGVAVALSAKIQLRLEERWIPAFAAMAEKSRG